MSTPQEGRLLAERIGLGAFVASTHASFFSCGPSQLSATISSPTPGALLYPPVIHRWSLSAPLISDAQARGTEGAAGYVGVLISTRTNCTFGGMQNNHLAVMKRLLACYQGHLAVAERLLMAGANIERPEEKVFPPLQICL